jgi:U3 small nucleolar RNA-associated protein 3
MARKRKASGQRLSGPKSSNSENGKLGPIRSYEDVADSEDEFHINRDKVLLEDEPEAKRRRKWEEEGSSVCSMTCKYALMYRCSTWTFRR